MLHKGLLEGKVALVTGAGKGIGNKTVERFAEEGAVVYATDIAESSLDSFAQETGKRFDTQIIPIYFDITDESEAKKAILKIKNESGHLDILVNNAGIMRDNVIGMIGQQLIEDVFKINVFSVINMIQLANKLMGRQKSGSIINISSIVGVEGAAGQLVYSASKGAVASLTKAAAKELAPNGIRVNAVAPGLINTGLLQAIGDIKIQENLKNVKIGRLGEPLDVANVILFLASDLSSYVTGEVIGIDGEMQV
ncbi:SDR family NAD(P)-dependent oxidoreductase [Treponema sp. Marseille-Q3903]|uniref:SDR family NAD(P)-dependent oxidoreductase n=1 Tax=Treponema sp. Marseille-Q3903 TaxID=2766703 RepID=UPI00165280EC|nr:SDR family NAD(P)-dependent oxidoreductase [Treponema sp. Marseille-Q3903]MBC6714291.1 SDR family oxidoreductase [Treponema sp. Marseille-Q3903]